MKSRHFYRSCVCCLPLRGSAAPLFVFRPASSGSDTELCYFQNKIVRQHKLRMQAISVYVLDIAIWLRISPKASSNYLDALDAKA